MLGFIVAVLILSAYAPNCASNAIKDVTSPKRESSTTFLRLTAPRNDEGIWTARFGEYEISIELKHHPKASFHKVPEDTWSLKIRHSAKQYKSQETENGIYNNEIPEEALIKQELDKRYTADTWQQIIDKIEKEEDAEEEYPTGFVKQRPKKTRRGKSRRQLNEKQLNNTQITEGHQNRQQDADKRSSLTISVPTDLAQELNGTNSSHVQPDSVARDTLPDKNTELNSPVHPRMEDETIFPEATDVKELAQENKRYRVVFDTAPNDTKEIDTDKSEQVNRNATWKDIGALIFDIESDKNKNTSSQAKDLLDEEEMLPPYALPLQQFPEDFENNKNTEISHLEPLKLQGVAHTSALEDNSGLDVPENIDNMSKDGTERGYIETDYVIEDNRDITVNKNDDDDDYGDDVRGKDSRENHYGDFEPTSEMKRIMDWFPRSKLLTVENNGYKYFPGVGWYKLITWPERWSSASKVCQSEFAHLAVPDSEEKIKVFLEILKNYPDVLERSILSNQVYIGVYNIGNERNFTTVLGKEFVPDESFWFDNEPDNADPGEDCVSFHIQGKLRDVPCFYNLPFLCEKQLDIS